MRKQKILYKLYIKNFLRKKILPIINNFTHLPPKKYTKSAVEKLKENNKFEIYDRGMPKCHGLSQIFVAIIESPCGKTWTCVYLFLAMTTAFISFQPYLSCRLFSSPDTTSSETSFRLLFLFCLCFFCGQRYNFLFYTIFIIIAQWKLL